MPVALKGVAACGDTAGMRAITVQSQEIDTLAAAAEVIALCTEQLRGERPVAAFLFASTEYEHAQLLEAIADRWPDLPLVGGSTDGEVSSAGFGHDSIVLTMLVGEGIRARSGLGRNLSLDPARAVAEALAGADGLRPALCWTVFAPTSNSTAIVRQIQGRIGACPIVGGLTGDHREYSRMVEFHGREVLKDSLPIMFLDGDLKVGFGVGTGWFPIGEPKVVTHADEHWVHTIDGRPALDVYRDLWGGTAMTQSLGEFPIAVFPNGLDGDYHLRAVLDVDQETGSIRVAGEVVTGSQIKLTEVLPEGILAGSGVSVDNAVRAYPGKAPQVAFVFSCAARKWVLGTKAEKEIDLLRAALAAAGVQPVVAGGYCFGEIAPQRPGAPSEFHNETCVTVLLGQ